MAPPTERYHLEEIADKIISLIMELSLSQPHGLGLNRVQFGGLEYLPTPQIPESILPCVFVKPTSTSSNHGAATTRLTTIHRFRIIYVRRFFPEEEIVRAKIRDLKKIANKLMDNFLLPGLVLSDGYGIVNGLVTTLEYEPPEDDIAVATAADISAAALVFEVTELGRRS